MVLELEEIAITVITVVHAETAKIDKNLAETMETIGAINELNLMEPTLLITEIMANHNNNSNHNY